MEISARGVVQSLGDAEILHGVDFDARSKRLVGIIGPNGSGKSTFLRCLYRTARPTAGTVFFDGQDVERLTYRESAQRVAVVAQHNFYNFDFTVEQVVLMGRTPHKRLMERNYAEDYDLVDRALSQVGLADMRARSFSTLSGGEQQRVILARALAQDTECLILDEPTNHLDITYQLQLMRLVKGLGLTVVAAVHDLNIAAMYCDELYVMRAGRLVAHGAPAEVLTPEFIQDVYGVRSRVMQDEGTGLIHVLFEP